MPYMVPFLARNLLKFRFEYTFFSFSPPSLPRYKRTRHKPLKVPDNTGNLTCSQSIRDYVTKFVQAGVEHGSWSMSYSDLL